MILIIPWTQIFLRDLQTTSLTFGDDRFGIRSEEFLQRLWIPAGYHSNRITSLVAFLTFPEVLPKVGQMIERMRLDSLLHCFCPLLVRDGYISNRPPHHPPESFDDLPHCWRFAHQRVYILGRHAGVSQKSGRILTVRSARMASTPVARSP